MYLCTLAWSVGSLVVRASDCRPECLGSMPNASKYTRSACSLNQWVRSQYTESTSTGDWRTFCSPSSSMPKLWRWRSVVSPSIVKESNLSHRLWQHSFLPFGNFTELNRSAFCMMLKAKATTGVNLAPCHDEFRGPRSDYVRQVA
ncbi:hypothetical protein TNCV_1193071 [Trichonephila clavipes]|nr:hypothetical protein TNCV_1193071 [Trichonephila clavipes]